ncbi:MAG: serine/threonine protein kinase [Planctomycetes bacterium]|nr:serine/threonine protein kinase [Planctomycetota bacterium]
MDSDSNNFVNRSEATERPLIDAAWAQFETLVAQKKSSSPHSSWTFTVPGYRVLREIHRGGQGVVYQALQESTQRKVAIKILKEGPLADERELARFDREVDVLSRLNHPHIVTIHDRGSAAGHAYYVMDYIPGRPLDAYVAGAALSTREVLDLFRKVCEAVNDAHLRGVIHRDLKPSNIRVNEEGEPRILDFGLAKLTPDASGSADDVTVSGQFIGSLPWASPEQADSRSDLLDIRTDVYSLGVILYQLLTGHFPYPVSGRMNEVAQHIIHTSPARPSTHMRPLDRDVEIILLKCLAKESNRRYQSAGELARDIQRYLNGEPIEARRATSLYQLRQFARRNKAAFVGIAAVFVVLVLGTIVSTVGFIRATNAERLAMERSAESSRSAAKAAAVSNFLQEMLSSVDPGKALGREVTIRQALDEAAAKVKAGSLKDQPAVEADLRSAIGTTYLALGHYPEADQHLRATLALRRILSDGNTDANLAADLSNLADVANAQGKYVEQEKFMRECLAVRRRGHTEDHADVASAEQGLAAALRAQGKFSEAEPHYRAALEMRRRLFGSEHVDVAQSLNSLALLAQNKGDFATAELLFREALDIRRKLLGVPHPIVADALNNLGNLVALRGNLNESEVLLREALEMRRAILPPDHPAIAQSLNNLGAKLWRKNDLAGAEAYYREALEIWRRTLPANHVQVASVIESLCSTLLPRDASQAESMLREAMAIREANPPSADNLRVRPLSMLGESLARQAKYDEAEVLLVKALDGLKEHPHANLRKETVTRLIWLYEQWNRRDDAAKWQAELSENSSTTP